MSVVWGGKREGGGMDRQRMIGRRIKRREKMADREMVREKTGVAYEEKNGKRTW